MLFSNALSCWKFNIKLSSKITLDGDDGLALLDVERIKQPLLLNRHFDKN